MSSVSWGVIVMGAVPILNAVLPILPPAWAAFVSAVVGLITLYVHSGQIKAGKVG